MVEGGKRKEDNGGEERGNEGWWREGWREEEAAHYTLTFT